MAKSNSNKNHKRNPNTQHSKWFVGTAVVVIALLLLSGGNLNLTGHVVQTSCPTCTNLSLELVNLDSIQVNGNRSTHSFAALRITSSRDSFRFDSEQKSTIWVLLKNRTRNGANIYNGRVIYQNSSSEYALAPDTGLITETNSQGNRDIVMQLPAYYYRSASSVTPRVVFLTNAATSTAARNVVRNGRTTIARAEVPEEISYNTSSVWSYGKWISYIAFGTGSAFGSPTATDATFRNAPGSIFTGITTYQYYANAPYCSTRGSCVETAPSTSRVEIKYAAMQLE